MEMAGCTPGFSLMTHSRFSNVSYFVIVYFIMCHFQVCAFVFEKNYNDKFSYLIPVCTVAGDIFATFG